MMHYWTDLSEHRAGDLTCKSNAGLALPKVTSNSKDKQQTQMLGCIFSSSLRALSLLLQLPLLWLTAVNRCRLYTT